MTNYATNIEGAKIYKSEVFTNDNIKEQLKREKEEGKIFFVDPDDHWNNPQIVINADR